MIKDVNAKEIINVSESGIMIQLTKTKIGLNLYKLDNRIKLHFIIGKGSVSV